MAATYALNIFNDNNDNNDHNEVLARPSLVAMHGQQSQFLPARSGTSKWTAWRAARGTVQDVPIGIKLSVTPTFLSGGEIQLEVSASRAFIEGRSSEPSFTTFAQTTKTTVHRQRGHEVR